MEEDKAEAAREVAAGEGKAGRDAEVWEVSVPAPTASVRDADIPNRTKEAYPAYNRSAPSAEQQ